MSHLLLPARLLAETFRCFQTCGDGRRECQVLWTSPWDSPGTIAQVVHSDHHSHAGGFRVDDDWLNAFWVELARLRYGVRVQVHTHPREAFHSRTDDAYPIVQTLGFLSLVIPDFRTGRVSFDNSFLCEIGENGSWRAVALESRITVVP